jgi:iron complex transport system substrate-binding protein
MTLAPRTLAWALSGVFSSGQAGPDAGAEPVPGRIIAIAPSSAEVICALGACDRIVGVSRFCVYPPELMDRPRVGGLSDPDLERITALRPNLVVTRGRSPPLERLCEEQKIPLYHDETDTLPGIERCVQELGDRLARPEQAQAVIREFSGRLDAVRARAAGRPKPRVFLTVSRDPDRLANILTAGKGTFLDQMIEAAGGLNVFGHLDMIYPQVSPEAVIAQRPEVIIEMIPELKSTPEIEIRLHEQWKQLGSIPAVQNGRVHVITDDNCLIPSPRFAGVVEKVSRILHPSEGK